MLKDWKAACDRVTKERRGKTSCPSEEDVITLTPQHRQIDIKMSFSAPRTHARRLTKAAVTKIVLKYLVMSVKPLSEVESKAFKELVAELTQSNDDDVVPSRYILTDRLEEKFAEAKEALKVILKDVPAVCTTADG